MDIQKEIQVVEVYSSSDELDLSSEDEDEKLLLDKITTKRSRVETLKSELESESRALVRLENILDQRPRSRDVATGKHGRMSWETIGSLLSVRTFRLLSGLIEFCGPSVIGALSSTALHIRDAVYTSRASLDLTLFRRKRFSLSELDKSGLAQRFCIVGIRLPLDLSTVPIPADTSHHHSGGVGYGSKQRQRSNNEQPSSSKSIGLDSSNLLRLAKTPKRFSAQEIFGGLLQNLDLSSCRSTCGDLIPRYLQRCPGLQRLALDNTNAAGDVADLFAPMIELREVRTVGCGALLGDVASGFAKLPNLTSLDLRKCSGIHGKLEDLVPLGSSLRVLALDGTGVGGNLNALVKKAPGLRRLRCSGMGHDQGQRLSSSSSGREAAYGSGVVKGTLAAIGRHCKLLEELHLSGTETTGTIEDIADLTGLGSVCLEELDRVNGDIGKGFHGMTKLREARLQGTSVGGDVAGVSHLLALTELRVDNTNVWGSLKAGLSALRNLTVVTFPEDNMDESLSEIEALRSSLPDCNIVLV